MTGNNHPNRGKRKSPSAETVLLRREHHNLTQLAAAKLIGASKKGWQKWENGERRMHPAFWKLFCILTPEDDLRKKGRD